MIYNVFSGTLNHTQSISFGYRVNNLIKVSSHLVMHWIKRNSDERNYCWVDLNVENLKNI